MGVTYVSHLLQGGQESKKSKKQENKDRQDMAVE
jgi:hypothetical protein